jgi:tetratricopeptide (TPR) repeat protein
MRGRAISVLVAVAAMGFAAPAAADTSADCLQNDDPQLKLAACGTLIDENQGTPQQRAYAYAERGRAHAALKQNEEAAADYDQAVALDPESTWALYLRGYFNRGTKRFAEAASDFLAAQAILEKLREKEASEAVDKDIARMKAELADTRARGCSSAEEKGARIGFCNDYLAEDHGDAAARANVLRERGLAYHQSSDYVHALEDYQASITLAPDVPESYYYRGLLQLRRDRYDAAEKDFQAYIEKIAALPAADPELTQRRADAVKRAQGMIDGAKADGAVETHWAAYLQQIQARKTYPNWENPPYDLYQQAKAEP